ncbi:MAG: hypothetical protein ACLQDM_27715 [Bradyrhizobium sp.]
MTKSGKGKMSLLSQFLRNNSRCDQGKSILLMLTPNLFYLLAYLPKYLANTKTGQRLDNPRAALFALCAALWVLTPQASRAAQDPEMSLKWHQADVCRQKAFKKFPDYTPEDNVRRENYRRACLRNLGLPAPDGPAAPQSHQLP